jgi:hypothetical protein
MWVVSVETRLSPRISLAAPTFAPENSCRKERLSPFRAALLLREEVGIRMPLAYAVSFLR